MSVGQYHKMLGSSRLAWRTLGLTAALLLAACAEAELVSHAAKQAQPGSGAEKVPSYKIGNPYQVNGVWYYPKVDYDYQETGIASWYGPNFHGNQTANGEIFDQHRLTAAHRTLPMPSLVRVTNLDNGRSVEVRVNDRGPFKNGRIIDLSSRAAELLGFQKVGTAKVLVEILEPESRQLASVLQSRDAAETAPEAAPVVAVQSASLEGGVDGVETPGLLPAASAPAVTESARAPLVEPEPDERVTRRPVRPTSIYVQAGAFVRRDNAVRLGARLSIFGPTSITETLQGSQRFYRVRLGPVRTVEDADRLLASLLENGHKDARVVVD